MSLKVVNFQKPSPTPAADKTIAAALREMAERLEGAQGVAVVADMGDGQLQIFVAGSQYGSAADALFLLALGQKKILEAAGS